MKSLFLMLTTQIIKEIRDSFKSGRTIFYDGDIEIETMNRDALGYCQFFQHSIIIFKM
jgi:hypothetical protein